MNDNNIELSYSKNIDIDLENGLNNNLTNINNEDKDSEKLDIEKIILPIGNDGMNSEGLSRATTKGTPQFDSGDWRETFVGYCALMVKAVDYLAQYADVDVIHMSMCVDVSLSLSLPLHLPT